MGKYVKHTRFSSIWSLLLTCLLTVFLTACGGHGGGGGGTSKNLSDNNSSNTVAETTILVQGTGLDSSGTILEVDADSSSLGTSSLTYYDPIKRLDFVSTSITEVSGGGDTATIKGEGKVNDNIGGFITGLTFIATITDTTDDAFGIEIRGIIDSQDVPAGSFTIWGTVVNGAGLDSFGAMMTLHADSSALGTSWLTYYDPNKRLDFVSTSITEVLVCADTATIKGEGKVNDNIGGFITGFTFTATVTDGLPDTMSIELDYVVPAHNISNGNYSISVL